MPAYSIALALVFCGYWLLNYSAFPIFDAVFIWTREISACVGGFMLAGVALAAFWRPRVFSPRVFTWGTAACMVGGAALVLVGVSARSIFFVVAGASLVTVGCGLANVFVGMGCVSLGARDAGIAISWAYVASFAARWLFALVPEGVNEVLFVVFPLVSVALVAKTATPALESARQSESPAQMSVTAPGSFVPFGHQVFVSLIVFRFVYGYSLTFAEIDRVPVVAFWALVPLCALLAWVLMSRKPFAADAVFRVSILFSVAGFLLVGVTGQSHGLLASSLLSVGTGFFEVLMYYALISLGAKNPVGALAALAWGNAMASWGTIFGATFGRITNEAHSADPAAISAVIVFALVAYVLFVLQRFSFSRTIENVVPVQVVKAPSESVGLVGYSLEQACSRLADRGKLTEREREVLDLLAHGRNARFIQDTLVVSYNTVKTHVSHIYAKLGVHAHQELIDLVERECAGEGGAS